MTDVVGAGLPALRRQPVNDPRQDLRELREQGVAVEAGLSLKGVYRLWAENVAELVRLDRPVLSSADPRFHDIAEATALEPPDQVVEPAMGAALGVGGFTIETRIRTRARIMSRRVERGAAGAIQHPGEIAELSAPRTAGFTIGCAVLAESTEIAAAGHLLRGVLLRDLARRSLAATEDVAEAAAHPFLEQKHQDSLNDRRHRTAAQAARRSTTALLVAALAAEHLAEDAADDLIEQTHLVSFLTGRDRH